MHNLVHSWQRCWSTLTPQDGEPILQQLLQAYQQPHRHYHTLQHLAECLSWFEQYRHLAQQPAEVELALWFHDAVYQTQASDNEQQSAAWAMQLMQQANIAAPHITAVSQLILATQHTQPAQTPDQQLLLDIDLAILAAPASRFAEYQTQIRAEYHWVPEALYLAKRQQILQSFVQRSTIYHTPELQTRWEQAARHNLRTS